MQVLFSLYNHYCTVYFSINIVYLSLFKKTKFDLRRKGGRNILAVKVLQNRLI